MVGAKTTCVQPRPRGMSADRSTAEPSDARFSMRALLAVMAAVSVVSAAAGAVLQQCSEEIRTRLIVFWAACLASTIGLAAVQFSRRRRAERQAGPTLLRLPRSGDRSASDYSTWVAILRGFIILIGLVFGSLLVTTWNASSNVFEFIFPWAFPLILLVVSSSHFFPALLWGGEIRLCECGVLWDQQMLPWDRLIDWKWKGWIGDRLELHSLDTPNDRPELAIRVAPEVREAVEKILEAKRNRSPLLVDIGQQVGIGRAPIHEVIGKEHFRRHLWRIIVAIGAGVGLFGLGFWRPTGLRQFDEWRLYGFYICLFVLPLEWRWSARRGGAPLARIFARRGWIGFLATLFVALILYAVSSFMLWPADWIAWIAGIAFWYLAIKTGSYFFMTELHLRANGIVIPGAFFSPWAKVKLVKWDPVRSNELVLRAGSWRQIFAIVPSERSDAIAALLGEKIGSGNQIARGR
jgi:hypothetical protein